MIVLALLVILSVVFVVNRVRDAREAKREADARRRASMRQVTERWHFREWERDLRSSDSV